MTTIIVNDVAVEAKEFTLYFVGYDAEDATKGLAFDSIESAESYAQDEGGDIYSVTCYVPTDPRFYTKENP